MTHVVRTRVLVASLAVTVLSGDLLAQASERVLYVTALDERSKVPVESLTFGTRVLEHFLLHY